MTESYNTRMAGFIAGKQEQYGAQFDGTGLNPNCVSHYNAGRLRRVKVRFPGGEERWGCVGVSTGWRPTFLLMRNRAAMGSSDVIGDGCQVVDYKDLPR